MDEMDVEKIYKEVYEEELAWSKLNNGCGGIAHFLKKVEHPDKKRLEEIIKDYTPDELKKLEAVKKDARKRTTLKVNISDLEIIGELIDRLEIVIEDNSRLEQIETKFKDAKKVYFSDSNERKDKLAVRAIQKLGWSTGKRPKKISPRDIFWEYQSLVLKENDPRDKEMALMLLKRKFGVQSRSAVIKHIQNGLIIVKEEHKLLNKYIGSPLNIISNPKFRPDRFNGILPSNWPQ